VHQKRLFGVVLAVTAMTACVAAAQAFAGATVFRFHFEQPEVFETALPECLPADLVGIATGVEITDGQAVETPSGGFEVRGTTSFRSRVDFPDGRYVLSPGGIEHFNFEFNRGGTVVTKSVTREPRTIYDASGAAVGRVTIHADTHLTFHDANGNGVPDDGEVTASVDKFFFTCN
jgi:hypothetical protein